MSTSAANASITWKAWANSLLLPLPNLFGVTIFVSSCLLFLIQPLASKLILPWFGGSSAVWITSMLFFQTGLLLGYAYAHGSTRKLSAKQQGVIHSVLLLLCLLTIPVMPNPIWQPKPLGDPFWRLLGVLSTAVGLPYVMLSSTSPLLQNWYARTQEKALPYRYFALSNIGSLLALLSYPILIEPYLSGGKQALLWSGSFLVFAALCITTAIRANHNEEATNESTASIPAEQLSWSRLILWTVLAACASALLLVVTNLLTQNVAPVPLFWVLPLSLYLLTFILCFEGERWYHRGFFLPLTPLAVVCLIAIEGPLQNQGILVLVPLLLGSLFVCCMVCHGELARLKPLPAHLTSFYLCVSLGGVLGGLSIALFAPHFFSANYENPIVFLGTLAVLLFVLCREAYQSPKQMVFFAWIGVCATGLFLVWHVAHEIRHTNQAAVLLRRNFYGALRVQDVTYGGRKVRELSHGTITHGLQFQEAGLRHQATTYYGRNSGIGLAWRILESGGSLRMGVIGLGTGTLATYGRSGDFLRFYELNPLMASIARSHFTYLADCAAHIEIVPGDARLTMSREQSQKLDILVVDAFSGDAIPVHLLTREAFTVYWRHLKPDGVMAVHVSNRYLNLAPVVKMAAVTFGKAAWQVDNADNDAQQIYGASYILVSNRSGFFQHPLLQGRLKSIDVPYHLREWTDDYSSLWQLLDFKEE